MAFPIKNPECEGPIPGGFIESLVELRSDEIIYGYRNGWISAADAGALATKSNGAGTPIVRRFQNMPPSQYAEVDRTSLAIEGIQVDPSPTGRSAAVWQFLALAWLRDQFEESPKKWDCVEIVYAIFGYPREMAKFIRYMPLPPGEASGLGVMEVRLVKYIEEAKSKYAARGRNGSNTL